MTRARWTWLTVGFVGGVAFLLVGALQLIGDDRYGALTDGMQALGLVVALAAAALTLRADSRNQTLDRVLALHQELMSGKVGAARVRLVRHLRGHRRNEERPTTLEELRHGMLATYSSEDMRLDHDSVATHRPDLDLNILRRYFERADSAREAGAVYLPVFADLIGGHAQWWDRALVDDGRDTMRYHLADLADWSTSYIAGHPKQTRQLHRFRERHAAAERRHADRTAQPPRQAVRPQT